MSNISQQEHSDSHEMSDESTLPSKTKRKKDMHALQEIGEQLVELDTKKLAEFDLPEILADAIRWRERLLSDEAALTEFAQKYPNVDLQQLRMLIRNTHKERAANKPPKSYRLIFQALQSAIEKV